MEWEASQAGLEEGGGWPGILQGSFEKVLLSWLLEPVCSAQCVHLSRAAIPSQHFIRQRRSEELWVHQTSHHLVQCKATEQFGSCLWCSWRKGKQCWFLPAQPLASSSCSPLWETQREAGIELALMHRTTRVCWALTSWDKGNSGTGSSTGGHN